jgi:hypothetical protein
MGSEDFWLVSGPIKRDDGLPSDGTVMRKPLLRLGGRDVLVGNHLVSRIEKTCPQADLRPVKSAFMHVGLGAGTDQLYISSWPAVRSSNQSDVFVEKDPGPFG